MSRAACLALLLAGLVLAAAPFLAWAAYAVHTFGTVLPNTNAAKRAGPGDSVVKHLLGIYALGFPLVLAGLVLLTVWVARLLFLGRRPALARVGSGLGLAGWLLFAWTAINSLFYVLNHTYVQTRYIFVTAPVLTIALLALAVLFWPSVYRAGAAVGLILGISLSLLSTWPLISNKIVLDWDYAALASFLRTLPPQAPVAHYSIGEAAYLSQHPLIDTGGITRPGIIPFLFDPTDDRRLAWIRSEGAQYIIIDHQPVPGARLVWHGRIPVTGWFLNPRRYRETDVLEVWTLPPA